MRKARINSIQELRYRRRLLKNEMEQTELAIQEDLYPLLHPMETLESYVEDEMEEEEHPVLDKVALFADFVGKGISIARLGIALVNTIKKNKNN